MTETIAPCGPAGPIPPTAVTVYIDADGSVTFSDLPADLAEILGVLNPDCRPACPTVVVRDVATQGDFMQQIEAVHPVAYDGDAVILLDQRLLPGREEYVRCATAAEVATGIRDMIVRGAPAIGITAGYGIALAARLAPDDTVGFGVALEEAATIIGASRPTAVNLQWAIDRMMSLFHAQGDVDVGRSRAILDAEARNIHDEDVAMNHAIGRHGAALIPEGATVLTHCNAGALATGGWGTALGVIRGAREAGTALRVIACETRPYLQGARLTAWELVRDGFDVTLITDNAAGALMAKGLVTCCVVGADRITANGDTANKIGTYTHAVLAARHGIPFYVAAPSSTLDTTLADGTGIVIEERSADEVLFIQGHRVAAEGVHVINPSFDVTPWSLITAIITEKGVHRPGPDGYGFTG